jgi:hypothetical protein
MSPLVLSVVGASLLIGLVVLAVVIVLAIRTRPAELSAAEPPREDREGSTSAGLSLPPIPSFPSPAHRLAPGIYMFGQLWRFDGRAWSAQLGDDCEPVVAIFDTPGLGTCVVTWDSVYRRTVPGGPWAREHQSPNGRPRLASGWGHPVHGLFAVGDRGTVLRSSGDGRWTRMDVPDALRTVISAVWGDDVHLHVGTSDGRVASTAWGSAGEWSIRDTPARDFLFDGASTPRGLVAVSQSGQVLRRPTSERGEESAWGVEHTLGDAVHGLLVDASGRVWISNRGGVFRSDEPGRWIKEHDGDVLALASNGAVTWGGGGRTRLHRRDGSGRWTVGPEGRSGTIHALWVGPDGELLVGTDFMLEVSGDGKGEGSEPLASVSVAS